MGTTVVTDRIVLVRSNDAESLYHNGHLIVRVGANGSLTHGNEYLYASHVEEGGPIPHPTRWQRARRWVARMVRWR